MISIDVQLAQPGYGFKATDASGNSIQMDTMPDHGGQNFGVRPMQALLMALGGCAGIDVVSILQKQRQEIKHFNMHIEGEREQGKEPSLWKTVQIVFELSANIDADKAQRAVQLSMEKYCSVAETLRRSGTELSWSVKMI